MTSYGSNLSCSTLQADNVNLTTINGEDYPPGGDSVTYKSISVTSDTSTIVEADGVAWKFALPAVPTAATQTLTINLPTNLITSQYFPQVQILGTSAPSSGQPVGLTSAWWVGTVLSVKREGAHDQYASNPDTKLVAADLFVQLIKYV
tara:strand:+ start:2532 stop:2975 length:444 start_codon:yes stop_codon:yes gene_type:complete